MGNILKLVICCLIIQLTVAATHKNYYAIPYYLTCPGVNQSDVDTKLKVIIGIMFDEPTRGYNRTQLIIDAGIEPDGLIPGRLLLPYSPLAMAAYERAQLINNDTNILPFHHLCIYYTFTPADYKDTARGANYIYVTSGIHLAINMLTRESQHVANSNLMTYFTSLISINEKWTSNICLKNAERLPQIFLGLSFKLESSCNIHIGGNMNILATKYNLYYAVYVFMQRMSWRRVGILTTCETCLALWPENKNAKLVLYDPNDFLKSFSPFEQEGYNVYIFLGNLKMFLKMLLEFNIRRTTRLRTFTWILPYYSTDFINDIDYHFNTSFTPNEIERIEFELKGSFVVFPIETFLIDERKVVPFNYSSSAYLHSEGYLIDAIQFEAKLAEDFLHEKANSMQDNTSELVLTASDKRQIVNKMLNFTIQGVTGKVSFDRTCNRESNTFNILNFVPQGDSIVKEIRAFVSTDPNNDTVYFCQSDGTLTKDVVTLIFYDGTSNIPKDVMQGQFQRSTLMTASLLVGTAIVYLILSVTYISFISRRDKKFSIYGEGWLYNIKEMRLMSGDLKDNTVASLLMAMKQDFQEAELAEVNDKIVKIQKLKMDLSVITNKARKEVLRILQFDHDNLCKFFGGITEKGSLLGIMYEYCSRGSLYKLIRDPNLVFNEHIRILFAVDIASGLGYLHDRKINHGCLTSHNCVVDNLWKLKLTDYGLEEFHSERKGQKSLSKYEGQTLDNALERDICKLGLILKEISCRQYILSCKDIEDDDSFDSDVSMKLKTLIEKCTQYLGEIPKIKEVIDTLNSIVSKYGLSREATGVAEVNSRHLEDYIEVLNVSLLTEKQERDLVLSKYIPLSVIDTMKDTGKNTIPLTLHKHVGVMCISLSDIEKVYSLEELPLVINTVDTILHSITTNAQIYRVHCFGTIWIYTCYLEDETKLLSFVATVAGIRIALEECQYTVTPCFAVHYDHLTCGTVKQSAPFYVVLGKMISSVISLVQLCPDNGILVSESVREHLPTSYMTTYFNYIIEEDGTTLPCYLLYGVPDVSASKVSVSLLSECSSKSYSTSLTEFNRRPSSSLSKRKSSLPWEELLKMY